MEFLESPRFPDDISYGSRGGPAFQTIISAVESGHERRSMLWSLPLHEYDVAYGVRSLAQLRTLREFFMVCRGRGTGFRFKDHSDFSTGVPVSPTDVVFGFGTGATTVFQLTKTYTQGAISLVRPIRKPVAGTVRIAVSTVEQTAGVDFSTDHSTGLVTFSSPPAADAPLSWGGEFDVPCRFDSDSMSISHDFFDGGAAEIILREVR